MDDKEEILLDYETKQMLAMYGAGVSSDDIADTFQVSRNRVFKQMREHTKEYNDAKAALTAFRVAKRRRAGEMAIDIQLRFLREIADGEEQPTDKEMKNIIKIGETAEKRADLIEGKATEITEHKGTTFKIEMPDGFKGENIT